MNCNGKDGAGLQHRNGLSNWPKLARSVEESQEEIEPLFSVNERTVQELLSHLMKPRNFSSKNTLLRATARVYHFKTKCRPEKQTYIEIPNNSIIVKCGRPMYKGSEREIEQGAD